MFETVNEGGGERVDRRSLPQQIATRLHEQISNGTYPGGSKLPHQRDLAASFGVSTAVAREALALLAAGDLIRSRPGRGTYVTDLPDIALRFPAWVSAPRNPGELQEAIEAREVLEHAIAMRAATRRSEADVVQLREILERMRAAGRDAAAFVEADVELHLAVATAANNRPLAGALVGLQRVLRESIAVGVRDAIDHDWVGDLVQSHADLVEAIAAGDADGAGAAMDRMIFRLRDVAHAEPVVDGRN